MKMGNTVPRTGVEPTSLAFWASMLPLHHRGSLMSPLYPRPPVCATACLRSVQTMYKTKIQWHSNHSPPRTPPWTPHTACCTWRWAPCPWPWSAASQPWRAPPAVCAPPPRCPSSGSRCQSCRCLGRWLPAWGPPDGALRYTKQCLYSKLRRKPIYTLIILFK